MPDFLGGALVLGLEDWLDCFSSVRTLSNTLDMVFRRASTAASIIFSNPLPSANSNEDEDEEEDEIGLTAGPGGLWEGAERLARRGRCRLVRHSRISQNATYRRYPNQSPNEK